MIIIYYHCIMDAWGATRAEREERIRPILQGICDDAHVSLGLLERYPRHSFKQLMDWYQPVVFDQEEYEYCEDYFPGFGAVGWRWHQDNYVRLCRLTFLDVEALCNEALRILTTPVVSQV